MLKGMTPDEKKKLGLSKATDYTYLTIVSTVPPHIHVDAVRYLSRNTEGIVFDCAAD